MMMWRVVDSFGLIVEHWGEKGVVYHRMSGETHQMDDFSISILHMMSKKKFKVEGLIDEIDKEFEIDNDFPIKERVTQLIRKFDNIGLIEPCY